MYDVIVCGAGIQGLWTSLYLVQQQKKVLLLEQFPLPHTKGSSHGGSRIIRYVYDTEHYTKMMSDAFKSWKDLEEISKTQLFVKTGLLKVSNAQNLEKVANVLTSTSVPYQHVKACNITNKFPGFKSEQFDAIFESTAGLLKADKCLHSLKDAFISLGGDLYDDEKVEEVIPVDAELTKIRTKKTIYDCRSVVLTCGPWINKVLLSLDLELPVKIRKVEVIYWRARDPEVYSASNGFPAIVLDSELKGHFYSTPSLEYPGLVKVCHHHQHSVEDPDSEEMPIHGRDAEEHAAFQRRLISQHFTELIPEPAKREPCMFTDTDDEDYILDRHPQYENVIIGAGFSGHGFKLAPVVGRILGDLALKNEPAYPLHHFAISRFK